MPALALLRSEEMFFSDLDRTLIYSKRFVSEQEAFKYVPVEMKEGRVISYMTNEAYDLLVKLRKEITFIPVTARKLDEIMRIGFIKDDIPSIMVCEGGKSIYRNGILDKSWELHINDRMGWTTYSRILAEVRFRELMEETCNSPVWNINEFMLMTKVTDWSDVQKLKIEKMIPWFEAKLINIHIHERKVYFVPKAITKGYAIQYVLKEFYGKSVSAGDTDMDATMFSRTSYHIAPKHHTIPNEVHFLTEKNGIEAAEDILKYAIENLS
jgi:hydroxymethylpyrimidine pyrophosphatase-like HAD family hydrolase